MWWTQGEQWLMGLQLCQCGIPLLPKVRTKINFRFRLVLCTPISRTGKWKKVCLYRTGGSFDGASFARVDHHAVTMVNCLFHGRLWAVCWWYIDIGIRFAVFKTPKDFLWILGWSCCGLRLRLTELWHALTKMNTSISSQSIAIRSYVWYWVTGSDWGTTRWPRFLHTQFAKRTINLYNINYIL